MPRSSRAHARPRSSPRPTSRTNCCLNSRPYRTPRRVPLVHGYLRRFCSREASASRMARRMIAAALSRPVSFWSFSRISRPSSPSRMGGRITTVLMGFRAPPTKRPIRILELLFQPSGLVVPRPGDADLAGDEVDVRPLEHAGRHHARIQPCLELVVVDRLDDRQVSFAPAARFSAWLTAPMPTFVSAALSEPPVRETAQAGERRRSLFSRRPERRWRTRFASTSWGRSVATVSTT